jgi:hypothetical protein
MLSITKVIVIQHVCNYHCGHSIMDDMTSHIPAAREHWLYTDGAVLAVWSRSPHRRCVMGARDVQAKTVERLAMAALSKCSLAEAGFEALSTDRSISWSD